MCANTGGEGGPSGTSGAGVGNGGNGNTAGGAGSAITSGGGIYVQNNSMVVNGCECSTNSAGNLLNNSSISGIAYTVGAGIYLDAASYNVVNACELTANWTCGIIVGNYSDHTLTDNLVTNCLVVASDTVRSTTLNGIVSYAQTTTNYFENNMAKNCLLGFVSAVITADKFFRNTAYNNATQYSASITNAVSMSGTSTLPGVNVTIP